MSRIIGLRFPKDKTKESAKGEKPEDKTKDK